MTSDPSVMAKGNYPPVEVWSRWDVDAAMEVQKSLLDGPLLWMNRTGRGLPELLDGFSNWFFLRVSAACTNVSEDVNFCTGNFNTFKGTDRKELGSEEGDIRVVTLTGTMILLESRSMFLYLHLLFPF